ncbi:glycosyltransferase family 2 protein [Saccharothrix xinjiangensis]|uniref:Glycosyltransferase family 2 protein n=1 Tax=Saccharothrix xinjiangensis TaxID=204798 RepID=A0ABV9XU64_9PSEU
MDIGVVIPTHRARIANGMTQRAIGSVWAQTLPAAELHVPVDPGGGGAWTTRDRGLQAVRAEWTAFLDSDDEFMPHHLETLARCAQETGADYVYSYYQVRNGFGHEIAADPLGHFGRVFDPADPIQTTITTLVRTELAQEAGFHAPPADARVGGQRYGEDYQFTLACVALGAQVVHVPQRTWWWNHHGRNTSGVPGQGDSAA